MKNRRSSGLLVASVEVALQHRLDVFDPAVEGAKELVGSVVKRFKYHVYGAGIGGGGAAKALFKAGKAAAVTDRPFGTKEVIDAKAFLLGVLDCSPMEQVGCHNVFVLCA